MGSILFFLKGRPTRGNPQVRLKWPRQREVAWLYSAACRVADLAKRSAFGVGLWLLSSFLLTDANERDYAFQDSRYKE
jgi:hypothetical protein